MVIYGRVAVLCASQMRLICNWQGFLYEELINTAISEAPLIMTEESRGECIVEVVVFPYATSPKPNEHTIVLPDGRWYSRSWR